MVFMVNVFFHCVNVFDASMTGDQCAQQRLDRHKHIMLWLVSVKNVKVTARRASLRCVELLLLLLLLPLPIAVVEVVVLRYTDEQNVSQRTLSYQRLLYVARSVNSHQTKKIRKQGYMDSIQACIRVLPIFCRQRALVLLIVKAASTGPEARGLTHTPGDRTAGENLDKWAAVVMMFCTYIAQCGRQVLDAVTLLLPTP